MAAQNFWTNSRETQRDPKRQFRFVMFNGNIPQWIVKSVTKPSFSMAESEHQYINHTFYYPGRVTWETVTMTLVDPVSPDAAQTMMAIIEAGGYKPPVNENDISTMSKGRAVAALGDVTISQIDADGNAVESWTLKNAWVQNLSFGDLDYSGDELTNIEVTLRYDFAILATVDKGTSPLAQNSSNVLPSNWNNGSLLTPSGGTPEGLQN